MALTDEDIQALQALISGELHTQIQPVHLEMSKLLNEISLQIDGLYKQDETRQQEYLAIRRQIERLEAKYS